MTDSGSSSLKAARDFAEKYKNATSEKQLAESFWRDFFIDVIGVSDLIVEGIEFQKPVRSVDGNINFIDCFWQGVLLIEHKSAGKDLSLAEKQARGYLEALPASERPPTLILSDFKVIRIIEVFKGTSADFYLTDLPDNLERFSSIITYRGQGATTSQGEADKNAVKIMSDLFKEFDKAGYGGHQLSVFLVRILFLNFGDDTYMWKFVPDGLFGTYLRKTPEDGSGLGGALQELFQVLNTPIEKRPNTLPETLKDFPYVNGGIFEENLPVFSFTPNMRKALVATTQYDWSSISPEIFGAMFQAVKDKETRRESGEFYTSEKSILRVISPLFLDNFTDRLQKSWNSISDLKKLRNDLSRNNYLDPASGSGNFLIVAYKKLRELELKIILRLNELEARPVPLQIDGTIGLSVHLRQFHAIEIDEWSSQIASVAMFLADHQSNLKMEEVLGVAPERFPLKESALIKQGNALRIPWDSVCPMNENTIIMGNPPFNGYSMLNEEQREDTSWTWDEMKGSGLLDYVANWFLIGAKWASERGVRVAFVATNSITQGEQPALIWGRLFQLGIGIDFAYRTFQWDNGAAVHCVILGFSTLPKPKKLPLFHFSDLKGEPSLVWANNINPYLIDAPNILVSARTKPISETTQEMDYGSKPTDDGHLSNISAVEAEEIRESDEIASKYLRPLLGAKELINRTERYCLWLVGAEPSDIRRSPVLSQRVGAVREFRAASKKATTQRDAERAGEFQEIRQPNTDFIVIPLVTSEAREYVPMAMLPPEVIVNNGVSVIANGNLRTFGLLMSKHFNVWNKTVSGRLKSDTRISGTITYNNFPFPETTGEQDRAIEDAAKKVLDARDEYPNSSLADLYDPTAMPADLRKAHQQLDKAVLSAYGLKASATDEEILANLFQRYEDLTIGLFAKDNLKAKISKKST